jgi:predicted nucleic acid-binding protein
LILCDVNVLIYASRSDVDYHPLYKSWLESTFNGPTAYGVAPQVLAGVVRICTHPRIFTIPSSVDDVFAFCRALLEQPNATVIVPGDRHWEICEWIITDRDYTRFDGLTWRTPF